uniref:RING-type E3 ubiquitin transferase n=1 Tax=Equus asinus TaxID=9793 RepID=A0A8C4MA24_EQUAS
MGGKQSTAARSRGPFPGVSTDDSAVPPPGGAPHFGHYRAGGGAMGLRSRSVSSVAGMGMDPSTAGGVSFGLYTPASRGTGDSERAPGGGGSASDSTYAHGNGYQETGGGHHRDGMLYLGSRASLADALPLHIAPRWFSSHSDYHLIKRYHSGTTRWKRCTGQVQSIVTEKRRFGEDFKQSAYALHRNVGVGLLPVSAPPAVRGPGFPYSMGEAPQEGHW